MSNFSELPVAIRCRQGAGQVFSQVRGQNGNLKLSGERVFHGNRCARLRDLLIQDCKGGEASPNKPIREEPFYVVGIDHDCLQPFHNILVAQFLAEQQPVSSKTAGEHRRKFHHALDDGSQAAPPFFVR